MTGVTLTHVLLQAAAAALRAMPHVNRVWLDDGPRFLWLAHCHVGSAIAADDNLIVATIPEPDRLGLQQLALTTRRAVDEGRRGRLSAVFTSRVAMTLSNLGMFGVDRFEAIVDPDQTAILAVGRTVERPAVTADGIAAVPQLDLALTVDHRTVDGRSGGTVPCRGLRRAGTLKSRRARRSAGPVGELQHPPRHADRGDQGVDEAGVQRAEHGGRLRLLRHRGDHNRDFTEILPGQPHHAVLDPLGDWLAPDVEEAAEDVPDGAVLAYPRHILRRDAAEADDQESSTASPTPTTARPALRACAMVRRMSA